MTSIFPFLVILVSAAGLQMTEGRCAGKRQYEHNKLCCNKCKPGTFVKQNCNATSHTLCETCQVGTFTKEWNQKTKCDSCRRGYYYDENISFCMPCKICLPGQYPVQKCTMGANTDCTECPKGTYSNVTFNTAQSCAVCTNCKKYKSLCTSKTDAVCAHLETPGVVVPTVGAVTSSATVKENPNTSDNPKSIIVVILIVVAITLFFGVACASWMCCTKNRSSCDRRLLGRKLVHYRPLHTGMLLRNQSACFILKLYSMLTSDDKPNWRHLAAEFGDFSLEEIANFAVDKSTAAEKMLSAWQTKNSSTVDRLYQCCLAIKREDVATYVAEHCRGAPVTLV